MTNLKIILKNGQGISCSFTDEAALRVIEQAVERAAKDVITIYTNGKPSGMILVDEIAAVLTPA